MIHFNYLKASYFSIETFLTLLRPFVAFEPRSMISEMMNLNEKWEEHKNALVVSVISCIHVFVEASKSSGKGLIEKLLSVCTHLINWPTMTGSIGWMSRVYCRFLKMKLEDFLFRVGWQIVAVKSSLLPQPLLCVLFMSFKIFLIKFKIEISKSHHRLHFFMSYR